MRAKTHLIYGESGTYKTTQAGFFAAYIWRKYKKRTRLISGDGGGWAPIEPYIRAGIIVPYSLSALEEPLTTIRKMSRGFWPTPAGNGKAVLAETKWAESDIGAYVFEGLTSASDLYMESLRKKRTGGEDVTVDLTIDGEKFAGNNRSHYNFVQAEIHSIVRGFSSLPVQHVLFSAHEGKGEDDSTREAIRGPGLAGKAATHKVPSWVGDCLHFESYPDSVIVESKDDTGKTFKSTQIRSVVRAYFTRHPDPKFPTVSYPAKPRVPAEQIPELFKRWPGGYFVLKTDSGLDEFLEVEDQLEQAATARVQELMKIA
jgi:hypothetical protein